MNILVMPSWYINKENPVRGSFFKEQAVALAKNGNNVYLVYVSFHPRNEFFLKEHFKVRYHEEDGIHILQYSIPSFGIERSPKLFFYAYKNLYKMLIKKVLKEVKIDIIHAHSFYPAGYVAASLKKELDIPVVVTEHLSAIVAGTLSKRKISFLRNTVANVDKFICVSEELKNHVNKYVGLDKKIEIVPNVLSPHFFYDNKVEKNGTFTFISIGGLIYRKRHEMLINAFYLAFSSEENVQLQIIGEGEERKKLEQLITSLGMEKKIKLLGRQSREKTAELLRKSNVFSLPSKTETFGVVYIEALACGLPVIAVVNGGAEKIVTEEDGIVTEPDNIEQLVKSLRYMFKNSHQYNNKEISTKCIKKYSEKSIAIKLNKIYKDVSM